MLRTEDEAKQTWCPFVRLSLVNTSDVTFNRRTRAKENETLYPDATMCIASKCMAWREGPPKIETVDAEHKPEGEGWKPSHRLDTELRRVDTWWRVIAKQGYCGLAGAV